ncbi:MAG: N-formylglutamate amidohydrolase [Rhodospirillaceae bacterium]|nr:N-formylglutamate amidohydrolase [Rhodospirillaceae bacterium]
MDAPSPARPDLLSSEDPSPVEIVRGAGPSRLLIHCDHGGNAVPAKLHDLGLPHEALARHIGWDIGAGAVARDMARRCGATAVIARYSRLVIDLNRPLGEPDSIPERSDGRPIPGNVGLSQADVLARAQALFTPYHHALDAEIARIRARSQVPVMLSIHSFTPALMARGSARPWHCGVMFSFDRRLGDHLLRALKARPGMIVGENEPYSGISHGYCMKAHGLAQGLPHAQIEIRQDLVCTQAGQLWWARLLAEIMEPILGYDDVNEIRHD